MMNKPTLSELMSKGMDSKYTLVMAIAKRARRIAAGEKPLVDVSTVKPVSIAANEVAAGKVSYFRQINDDNNSQE
jgi:DNA-directed RNA polymerase subunit omega